MTRQLTQEFLTSVVLCFLFLFSSLYVVGLVLLLKLFIAFEVSFDYSFGLTKTLVSFILVCGFVCLISLHWLFHVSLLLFFQVLQCLEWLVLDWVVLEDLVEWVRVVQWAPEDLADREAMGQALVE